MEEASCEINPPPNQFHQFHQSLLWEWRDWLRIDWNWRAMAAQPVSREKNERSLKGCLLIDEIAFLFAWFVACAVMGGTAALLRKGQQTRREERQLIHETKRRKKGNELCFADSNLSFWMKWRKEMRRRKKEAKWMEHQAEARQAHHFIQSISLCEGDWWMQWMEGMAGGNLMEEGRP